MRIRVAFSALIILLLTRLFVLLRSYLVHEELVWRDGDLREPAVQDLQFGHLGYCVGAWARNVFSFLSFFSKFPCWCRRVAKSADSGARLPKLKSKLCHSHCVPLGKMWNRLRIGFHVSQG